MVRVSEITAETARAGQCCQSDLGGSLLSPGWAGHGQVLVKKMTLRSLSVVWSQSLSVCTYCETQHGCRQEGLGPMS